MKAKQAAAYLLSQYPTFEKPRIGFVLGSGLGAFAEQLTDAVSISYVDIPGFPVSTVSGHAGKCILGYIADTPVVCFQGRAHPYEGGSPEQIKTLIRTLRELGCEIYCGTNAVGSLRPTLGPGGLLVVNDHINFQFSNPLVGANDEAYGPRFIGMDEAYDPLLREQLQAVAKSASIPLTEGVYIATLGPHFETPAEIRAFRTLGADVVGMSTVPEVLIARHCQLRVMVLSVVTNYAAGLSKEKLTHEGTLHHAQLAAKQVCELLVAFTKVCFQNDTKN